MLIGGISRTPGLMLKIKEDVQNEMIKKNENLAKRFKFVESPFNNSLIPWIGGSLIGRLGFQAITEVDLDEFKRKGTPDWIHLLER